MKIPDDVFMTRCRYCGHGQTGAENKEIPDDKLFIHFWAKQSPCGIIGIAQCDKVQGECLDFKPNPMKCPYHYPASLLRTGVVIMDEIGPWPPKGKGR